MSTAPTPTSTLPLDTQPSTGPNTADHQVITAQLASARIDPLNGPEDWIAWSIQLTDLLWSQGLTGYIDGTEIRPDARNEDALKKWTTLDRITLIAIRSQVSKKVLTIIRSETTSQGA